MGKGLEIEVKYRLKPGQRQAIAQALTGMEAERSEQEDQYYDVGDRVLRIRCENGRWLLTRKDRFQLTPDGTKIRPEVEVPIPDDFVSDLEALILWLGHDKLTRVRKVREAYQVEGVTVALDRIEGLSDEFAEFEVLSDRPDAAAKLTGLRERFGLTDEQVELSSYARLVAEAGGGDVNGRE
ncbi:CYTH domain protein [compost metagenome]